MIGPLLLALLATDLDNRALECGDDPTYYPRGDRWNVETTSEGAPEPIEFRLHTPGASDLSNGVELDALSRAATAWNLVACPLDGGTAPPHLILAQGELQPLAGNQDNHSAAFYENNVFWARDTNAWDYDSLTLAVTESVYDTNTGRTYSADIIFNEVQYRWRGKAGRYGERSSQWQGCPHNSQGCFDVESVALHEFGHFIGLNHVTCPDAIMFPNDGGHVQLSVHEAAGICALYPPRPGSTPTNRKVFGEACESHTECLDGTCIEWCTETCTRHDQCNDGYACLPVAGHGNVCLPSPRGTPVGRCECDVDALCNGGCDCDPDCLPPGGCLPCIKGTDCPTGICISDEHGENGACSQVCSATHDDCPDGFSCLAAGDAHFCYPDDASSCYPPPEPREINEECYEAQSGTYVPCAPGALCFLFQPPCGQPAGECVGYCNPRSPCAEGLTCCYYLDDNGECATQPTEGHEHGGCFNLRQTGETCAVAENAICEGGNGCFLSTSRSGVEISRCYEQCPNRSCGGNASCVQFASDAPSCNLTFDICCEAGTYAVNGSCLPGEGEAKLGLGVSCGNHNACDSGLCLNYNGAAACTRSCNDATHVGCPAGTVDMNQDGINDGTFTCVAIEGTGRCWPVNGPVQPYDEQPTDPGTDLGGEGLCGCRAQGVAEPGLYGLIIIAGLWRRRRRS